MPTAPTLDNQQVSQEGLPGVHYNTDAPAEAFGGGKIPGQMDDATQGVLDHVQSIVADAKQKADEVAGTANVSSISQLKTNIQVATSKMQGKDALAAPDVAQKQWDDGLAEIRKGAVNQDQSMFIDHYAASSWDDLNKSIQMHVSGQMQQYDDNETKGAIDNSRTAAVLNAQDNDQVAKSIQDQETLRTAWAARKGIPTDSDQFKSILTDDLSSTHSAVINARLNAGLTDQAQSYFEANKSQMSAADIDHSQKTIEDGLAITRGNQAYASVAGMKLSDGSPDEDRMRTAVMNMDLPDKEKERAWEFVKARANEDYHNNNKEKASNDLDFMNDLITGRKQGASMEDSLKLVNQYGRDPYDMAIKEAAIQKMYAPPSDSDPKVKFAIWQGIQDGTANPQDIDKAMQDGKISTSDWDNLKKEQYKVQVEGHDPVMKLTNSRIQNLAKSQFGSDQEQLADYMNVVNLKAQGKSPDEKFKIAQDELKDSSQASHNLFGFQWGHDTNFVADTKTNDANRLAFGQAKQDLGQDVVRAIGNGVSQTSGQPFTPAHIEAFSGELGGYDNIKPGTPNNAAIKYLMAKGYPVVPQNVKWAADKLKSAGGQ